ncbi:MAG: DEAD/DEAH box helicase family protein, partial [Sphaerochaetaceae bacterium]
MYDFDVKEKRFEEDIENSLYTEGGFTKGDPKAFDRKLALDKNTFISFIKTSQPKQWERYVKIYGEDSEKQIIERFCREVKMVGLLHVFRKGFIDRGIKFLAIFWQPETSINKTTAKQYKSNIMHCTRQLHYSLQNENSIDIVLLINGIPVISMELKCQFTGQNTANAIAQYKFDRAGNSAIFEFKNRVLAHFAVDLTNVYMTTRLQGNKTYFLPFNQGSNGAGKVGGRGNPVNPEGYDTAYLWKNVLCKERLLEIIHKYLHLQVIKDDKTGDVTEERMIFPRYQQLDVVTKLLDNVKKNGAGHNYLIQHSAGSGKSNSIAWLAYRLTGLHDSNNEKIFQSVIIVTDRRVLDSQLQNTVYQFDHVEGVVQKIDKDSQQLKKAIEDGTGIIITTLQKFPVIYKEVKSDNKRFAVIVDEAHSSQTGNSAKKLKRALADTEKILEEYAEIENEEESKRKDDEDKLLDELAAQGNHENLSFFAFTATPKDKTLQMFGWRDEVGKYHPFHIYSMRQAIEERFILDVLQNYMTYKMYYKITKTIVENPELDTSAGAKAITNYETLHPHNISQKTAIILEQFRNVTMHKIGGKAKAMIVTPSRLHAVRYLLEFKRQIAEKGYNDLDVLVAFSGEVEDDGEKYTEEKINKNKDGETIRERALPEAFHTDEFGMLIVAEKYQTGFDEPLLHTMFVDKKLSGVKAVQTLSRLNRIMPGKRDTFVLDFVNSAEEIKKSFEPYYEETVLEEETNPNVIYDLKNTLDEFRVYQQIEIDRFAEIFYASKAQLAGDMGKLQGTIKPALDRYEVLEDEQKDLFKSTLSRFNRIYAFVTQVCRLFDKEIHKFSVYSKFLAMMLPKGDIEKINVDDKVLLEYYRLEKEFEGTIELEGTDKGFQSITGESGRREKKKDPLTVLIAKINEKYGTNFTEMDKVLLQLENDYASEEKWQSYAKNNDRKTFMLLFKKDFPEMAATRYEKNDDFFVRMFSDPDMMKQIMESIGAVLYE